MQSLSIASRNGSECGRIFHPGSTNLKFVRIWLYALGIAIDLPQPTEVAIMVVKAQSKGRDFVGLQIVETDVERYFPKDTVFLELQLDHLQIQCSLGPDFWRGRPEICDPRLSLWLKSKNLAVSPGQLSVPLALIPAGIAAFHLSPLRPKSVRVVRPAVQINAA